MRASAARRDRLARDDIVTFRFERPHQGEQTTVYEEERFMAEELQGLLERIHSEGVQKAETEKDALIAKAKEEAQGIVAKATEEAETLRRRAEDDAAKSREKAEATIRQAARDIIISLETELNQRLASCVKGLVAEAMTPELMSDIVKRMLKAYAADKSDEPKLELILPAKDLDAMSQALKQNLAMDVKSQPEFFRGLDFAAGVKVGFKGDDVFFDFSDSAVTELIMSYVGPRLAATIKGAAAKGENSETK